MNRQIEQGIPLPKRKRGIYKSKYSFHLLGDGDSMFFSVGNRKKKLNIMVAASQYGIRNGLSMATRSQEDGIRVWRVGKKTVDTTGQNP
jgi:hypothetical protein